MGFETLVVPTTFIMTFNCIIMCFINFISFLNESCNCFLIFKNYYYMIMTFIVVEWVLCYGFVTLELV